MKKLSQTWLINQKFNCRYKLIKYRHLGVRENNLNLTTPTDHDMNHLERLAHEAGCFNTIIV